jgi:hypothetical protein
MDTTSLCIYIIVPQHTSRGEKGIIPMNTTVTGYSRLPNYRHTRMRHLDYKFGALLKGLQVREFTSTLKIIYPPLQNWRIKNLTYIFAL